MKLEFFDWQCGHHQETPAPIEDLSEAQAKAIMTAISHAISQPFSTRARLIDGDQAQEYYMTDDYISPHTFWSRIEE